MLMIDARPEVDIFNRLQSFRRAFNQHSVNERSLPKTAEIPPSGKDVPMTGMRSEEVDPKMHSGKPAAAERFPGLNDDFIRPKGMYSPKIYHQSF